MEIEGWVMNFSSQIGVVMKILRIYWGIFKDF